jgi:hypothetical protein
MNSKYNIAKCLHLMKEKVMQLSSDDGHGSSNLKIFKRLRLAKLGIF